MFHLFLRHPVGPLHSPGFDVSRFVIFSSGVSAISKPAQMIHLWSGRDQPQDITAGTKVYCLVTQAHVCAQLAQGC